MTRHEEEPDIKIDDVHPVNDGFLHAYKGTWKEKGVIATVSLDLVEMRTGSQGSIRKAPMNS